MFTSSREDTGVIHWKLRLIDDQHTDIAAGYR